MSDKDIDIVKDPEGLLVTVARVRRALGAGVRMASVPGDLYERVMAMFVADGWDVKSEPHFPNNTELQATNNEYWLRFYGRKADL